MRLCFLLFLLLLGTAVAGPVYTIPADYERIHKVVEGLLETTNLSGVSTTSAYAAGANVRETVEELADAGIMDLRGWLFTNAGRIIRDLTEGAAGRWIGDWEYWYFSNAGSNIRNLTEGAAGRWIGDWEFINI